MLNRDIKVKAMCLFERNGKFLASKGYDTVKKENFYRILGGHLDFGERAEDGVRREIREELGCEIEKLKFLTILENIFTYNGQAGHEVIFLYTGELSNKKLYDEQSIFFEEPGRTLEAVWLSKKDILANKVTLYPSFNYKLIEK